MSKRIKEFWKSFADFSKDFSKLSEKYGMPAAWFYADALCCRVFHGTNVSKYFALGMYRMNNVERRTFVTGPKTNKLEKLFNPSGDKFQLMDDKCAFNRRFHNYIKREWMYAPDHSAEEIEAFLRRNEAIMVKPPLSNMGKGVYRVACAEALKELDSFVEKMRTEKLLMEAFICQHPEVSRINPTSVNTVRVATVRDRMGEVHVIGTSLRVGGKGAVVDNFHADGVQYPVDPQTGIVIGGGVNITGARGIYFHPATNTQVIGFQIPHWDQVIAMVKEAAGIPKDIRYIGWDIAITDDGCDMVEANINQGSNGMQQDGIGKYRIIMQYL